MKKIFCLAFIILFTNCELLISKEIQNIFSSQDDTLSINDNTDYNEYKPKYGIFADYGLNIHSANFNNSDIIPSCCQDDMFGYNGGFLFGALMSYPINDKSEIQARLSYNNFGALLLQEEEFYALVENQIDGSFDSTTGAFEYRLDTKFKSINLQTLGAYKILDNFYAIGGFDFGLLIQNEYFYIEKILRPIGGYFQDNNRSPVRNAERGQIKDISSFYIGLTIGGNYQLRVNEDSSLFVCPELFYHYILTPIVTNTGWNINSFRAGLAVKYMEPPPPPPPPDLPMEAPLPNYPKPVKPLNMFVDITASQIDSSNNANEKVDIKIEDFVEHNMSPLLNYIFFEENSSEIPERYAQFSEDETHEFHVTDLQKLNVLQTYYHILNICGLRLRQDSISKITLTGTNSYSDDEKGNLDLSLERAESVKEYLTDVWNIDPNRIIVKARHLPEEPSNPREEDGKEENRRVEIESDDWRIIEPVIVIDTTRSITKTTIRFFPKSKAEAGIRKWNVSINQNGWSLKKFNGNEYPPDSLDWEITSGSESAPKKGGQISYSLTAEDSLGQVAQTADKWLHVEQLTIEKKRIQKVFDREYEYYSLILFDYGKYKLRGEHKKVVDFIKQRIKPDSKVVITGHTDIMGKDALNKRISESRAKAVAERLDLPNVHILGTGEENLLYDNDLPEGRFYCRTVRITIETPVNHK